MITLDPRYATDFVIGLEHDAPAAALLPGAIGQVVAITFAQNGVGGRSYSWPALCVFDGGAAVANATASWSRQRCEFVWTGSYWAQVGPVVTTIPPQLPFAPVADNFAAGNPFWLSTPSSPNGRQWEHMPGGGSLGIKDGVCVCNSLGWIGDNDIDLSGNGAGLSRPFGAGAVIECGGDGSVIVQATISTFGNDGVIARCLDDRTFWIFRILNGSQYGQAYGWSHGVPAEQGPRNFYLPAQMAPGQQHTLTVKCTATGFVVVVDGTVSTTLTVTDIAKWSALTRHGIVAGDTRSTFSAFSAGTA